MVWPLSAKKASTPAPGWTPPKWDPDHPDLWLQQLREYADAQLGEDLEWYRRSTRSQRKWSRLLRGLALGFSITGGLVPLVRAALKPTATDALPDWLGKVPIEFGQLGYVLLAVAAGIALFDRFFGFSSAWMRFVGTQLELERIQNSYRLEWIALDQLGGLPQPPADLALRYVKLVQRTLTASKSQALKETRAWIAEFQTNLAQFEKDIRSQAEAARPGAIDVTIVDGQKAPWVDVLLDSRRAERVTGNTASLANVSPGLHQVTVRATVDGRTVAASQMVTVEAAAVANVELVLGA